MPFADLHGIRLQYRLEGPPAAPVVVLSSSLGTDHRLWDAQAAGLSGRFRVLRYDPRGHGASSVPPGPWDIAALGRDVLGLLDAVGIAEASFCGLSLGGMVGMWLGVNAPRRIRRLVLANTAAWLGPPERWEGRIGAVRAGGMAAVVDGVLARWLTPAFRAANPAEEARLRGILLATPPEGYAAACGAIRDMDQRAAVGAVRAPTLVVAGASDEATPLPDARFLVEAIPGAHLVELPAAHLSNVEAAGPFTRAVAAFLSGEEA
jgi:3-oxoadipate enol-lactonase